MTLIPPSFPPAMVARHCLTLSLPPPPSINSQYATVNGRRILSAVGRGYKTAVAQQVMISLSRSPHRDDLLRTLRTAYLALSIRFHFTSPLRRDVDGGLKITQDALCEALGINDNRVFELHLYKRVAVTIPYVEVSLSPSKFSSQV